MMRRRKLFAWSFAVSLFVHASLLVAAPHIGLMAAPAHVSAPRPHFQVRMRDDSNSKPSVVTPGKEQSKLLAKNLTSRPESITDLLNRESEPLKPTDSMLTRAGDITRVVERAAAEAVPREHEITPEESVSRSVDAQIIAISEDVARKDIEVPRRLLSPTPTRILPENDTPAMTGDAAPRPEESLVIPPLTDSSVTTDTSGAMVPADETPAPPPPMEEPLPVSVPIAPAAAPLGEMAIAKAPIAEEIQKERTYEFMDDLLAISLDTYKPTGEKDAYFRIKIQPKDDGNIEVLPKDVTFVIDASSSIIQRKLDLTAAGVKDAIKALRPEDRFNVVVFRDTATSFRPGVVLASAENKSSAESFLTGLKSYGETDVYKALEAVLNAPTRPGIPDVVLMITDGRPTTGVKDGRTVINTLTEQNTKGFSIFAFGGGQTVNRYLLDLLSYRNKGESFVAPKIETMNRDIVKFFGESSEPILSDCIANLGGVSDRGKEVFPKIIPDFYRGRAVTVYGRFDPTKDKEFSMRLSGLAGTRKKEVIFRAELKKAGAGDENLARNWAFNKIYYLIGEMCRVGEKPELLSEVRELSRKYKIKTSYDG